MISTNMPIPSGPMTRRASRGVLVQHGQRKVWVGGDAPVVVQSMTNTDTADAIGTAIQVKELARAGSEIVRITVNTPEAAAAAVPAIREQLDRMGVDVPLVGDFHYNGHLLLRDYPGMRRRRCRSTASIRATSGSGAKRDTPVRADDRDRDQATTSRCASASTGAAWTRSCSPRMMDENARPRRSRGRRRP